MNKTIKLLSAIAFLFTSQLMAMGDNPTGKPTENPEAVCKAAYDKMLETKGSNINKGELAGHCGSQPGSSCFNVESSGDIQSAVATLLEKSNCKSEGNAKWVILNPRWQAKCFWYCADNIGKYGKTAADTNGIQFNIFADNKDEIYNLYPTMSKKPSNQ